MARGTGRTAVSQGRVCRLLDPSAEFFVYLRPANLIFRRIFGQPNFFPADFRRDIIRRIFGGFRKFIGPKRAWRAKLKEMTTELDEKRSTEYGRPTPLPFK